MNNNPAAVPSGADYGRAFLESKKRVFTMHEEVESFIDARAREFADKTCAWAEDEDGSWDTACGEKWQFTHGGPSENNFRFCHGCGKPVAITEPGEPDQ
jgi:hypothetical protein